MADRKSTTKAASATDSTSPDAPAKEPAKPVEKSETKAAPILAPELTPQVMGHDDSSTNFAAANAALRSVPGANHIELLNEAGDQVDPEKVFEFPPAESPSMLATVQERVFQRFTYPGASTPTTQLLYPAGAVVPIGEALRARDGWRRDAHSKELKKQQ